MSSPIEPVGGVSGKPVSIPEKITALPNEKEIVAAPETSVSISEAPVTSKPTNVLFQHIWQTINTSEIENASRIYEVIDLNEYLSRSADFPEILRTSDQRIYDMILKPGRKPIDYDDKVIFDYEFFRHPVRPQDAVSGAELALHDYVTAIGGAAQATGPDNRIILLAGPVGSVKTTIVTITSTGLEEYTQTDEGQLYSLVWDIDDIKDKLIKLNPALEHISYIKDLKECPIFEDPINVIPRDKQRRGIINMINEARISRNPKGRNGLRYMLRSNCQLCPSCNDIYETLKEHYNGNISKVLNHVKAKRFVLNENARRGITFFGAKDDKSANAKELSGDVNMRMLLQIGSDSNPQALLIDGEITRANRGIAHLGEVLKHSGEVRLPLLDMAEGRKAKIAKAAQIDFDCTIFGTSNMPDWQRILKDRFEEAQRSRIVTVVVPYLENYEKEAGIYEKTFSKACKELGVHEAPHARETAALWAVLTRLVAPKHANLTLLQKALLYAGKKIPGFSEHNVVELKREAAEDEMELLKGISPRDIMDALSTALKQPDVEDENKGYKCVDPYNVIDRLKERLKRPVANATKEDRDKWLSLLNDVEEKLDEKLRFDLQDAISGDDEQTKKLFNSYIKNVNAYTQRKKVKDVLRGNRAEEPDETLMRSIEDEIGIPESRKDDFRRELMNQIADLALDKKEFTVNDNERLKLAIKKVLVNQHRDVALPTFKTELASNEEQEKIEVVKGRLYKKGYCSHCAITVLRISNNPHKNRQK